MHHQLKVASSKS